MSDDLWDKVMLSSLSDDGLRFVIRQSRDHLEQRRLGGFNKIPQEKIDKLAREMREFWNGKKIDITVSVTVPVTIHYGDGLDDDGDPYWETAPDYYCDEVPDILAGNKTVLKEIEKAKKRWIKFSDKIAKLSKKYNVNPDIIWDELENRV